jgi:hypothetical protein
MRHILVENSTRSDHDKQYNRWWKLRMISDILNQSYSKFYKPLKHLAVNQVIVKFKDTIIFKQYVLKKRKCFRIKIYELHDDWGHTYDMWVYLGKDWQHSTVLNLTHTGKGVRQTFDMQNFFCILFNDLHCRKINSGGTVKPNKKTCPLDFQLKEIIRGDTQVRTKGGLMPTMWKQM